MASINDYVDMFLDSDILFCTVTGFALFLCVFFGLCFFCDGPDDGECDQLEDEDFVYNGPFYFSSLVFCVSSFVVLISCILYRESIANWEGGLSSEDVFVAAMPLLIGALGLLSVISKFQEDHDATLPLPGKYLLGEDDEVASPVEIVLEDSILHCTKFFFFFFTTTVQIVTLPAYLVKTLCEPLVTAVYGPICASGEIPVSREEYDALRQELHEKSTEIAIARLRYETLQTQIEIDQQIQSNQEDQLNIARLEIDMLNSQTERDQLRHEYDVQELQEALSAVLAQIGVQRDAQMRTAAQDSLELFDAAAENDSDIDATESALSDVEPEAQPGAAASNAGQTSDIKALENTALDEEHAEQPAAEEEAAPVAEKELGAEESEMDEGDYAEKETSDGTKINDSVDVDQLAPQAPQTEKKRNKKKKRAGKEVKDRQAMVDLEQQLEAAKASRAPPATEPFQPAQQPAQEQSGRQQQRPAQSVQPIRQQAPPQLFRPLQPQALSWHNGWQHQAPRQPSQSIQHQSYGRNGWPQQTPMQSFQQQQQIHGQNVGQQNAPAQIFQAPQQLQQQGYGHNEWQHQLPTQFGHTSTEQHGQSGFFGPQPTRSMQHSEMFQFGAGGRGDGSGGMGRGW
jgi:hypothetical protein